MKRHAITLTEILIAAVVLALVGVPIIGVFMQSKQTITRTDTRREIRHYILEIVARAGRVALHSLWDNFGPGDVVPEAGRLRDLIAVRQPDGSPMPKRPPYDARTDPNPLNFDADLLRSLKRDGYDARLHFEFFSKKALRIGPDGKPPPDPGIMHMQAGFIEVRILDAQKLAQTQDVKAATVGFHRQTMMCPAIVGRPGIRQASCPARNDAIKDIYEPLLAQREQALADPPPF